MMFDFKIAENFEPSKRTKEWCLYAHKTEQSFASVVLPGLFDITHYGWQLIGFFAIFLLEGLATYWSYYQGVAITAILVLIFIDIFLAVCAHMPHKVICMLANENVFAGGEKNKSNRSKIAWRKKISRLFYALILISAGLKCYWFYSAYVTFDSTALFILVCYSIGAVLHITCTGYAVFTTIFKGMIDREYSRYIHSTGTEFTFDPNDPRELLIGAEVQLSPVIEGRHELVKKDGTFYLLTKGVLTDDELGKMIGRQLKPEQQRALAVEGVRQQCEILKQPSITRSQWKATLTGTVTDENDAVVAGAAVTVTDPTKQFERQVTTNNDGFFIVPQLPPSNYMIKVQRTGFATAGLPDVVLNVGDQSSIRIQLKVAQGNQTIPFRQTGS